MRTKEDYYDAIWISLLVVIIISMLASCSSSRPGYKAQRVQQRHLQNQFP